MSEGADGKGAFPAAPDPVRAARSAAWGLGAVHVLLWGILWAILRHADTDQRAQLLDGPAKAALLLGTVGVAALYWILRRTRRLACLHLLFGVVLGTIGCQMLLLSAAVFVNEVARDTGMRPVFLGFGIVAALVIGLLEWRVVPWLWRHMTARGRVDLESALFHPEIPPVDAAQVPRALRWQVPAVYVGLLAVWAAQMLRMAPGQGIVLTLLCSAGALLFGSIAWAFGFGIAWRVGRWELANRRGIVIAQASSTGGQN